MKINSNTVKLEKSKKKAPYGTPDGTGPHGKGMGPGKGKGDGTGLKKTEKNAYEELEEIIKKIASENKIENVKSVSIKLSKENGVVKFAIEDNFSDDYEETNEKSFIKDNYDLDQIVKILSKKAKKSGNSIKIKERREDAIDIGYFAPGIREMGVMSSFTITKDYVIGTDLMNKWEDIDELHMLIISTLYNL
jgi:hypothetical protein